MPVHNAEIADTLNRLADLLEIDGANPFRVRAYRNAARVVTGLPRAVSALLRDGQDLAELPGIGHDLAGKIQEIAGTGKLAALEEIERRTSPDLVDLLSLPHLGPARVRSLRDRLGITTLQDLRRAVSEHRLQELPGFGTKLERSLGDALEARRTTPARFKLSTVQEVADSLLAHLQASRGLGELVIAGSFRRRKETVGDLDVLATAKDGAAIMDRLVSYDEVRDVLAHGTTRTAVVLRSGLQVDLRVVPAESYGAALHYFTGSKAHNIAIRTLGLKLGLKLNEYGVFRGAHRLCGRTEEEVYRAVGLPYIAPELRENSGELEAARRGHLPALITRADIRGDLHAHTVDTDGTATLEQMAEAAKALGYEYLAITDHSKRVTMAHGLDSKRLAGQLRRIDRLNARLCGITLLKGCEVDILEDGSLDLPDAILRELDLTVCSLHYGLHLPRARQTDRVLRAMDHPYFRIWGHPTGRLIEQREPCELDLERLLVAAHERGHIVELNAQPDRLDLSDVHCRRAREIGVKVSIATDAHRPGELAFMAHGIDQARRGWLEAADVVNTLPLAALRQVLRAH